MGLIATVLSFLRVTRHGAALSDVKADPGGGCNITAEHFQPAGDDSYPMPEDYVLLLRIPQTGKYCTTGYVDPNNEQTAGLGGKRIYSRDADGTRIAQVWLKNDGTILAENENAFIEITPAGQIELSNGAGTVVIKTSGQITASNGSGSVDVASGGTVTINGLVTIDTSGNITTPGTITGTTVAGTTSLTVDSKEVDGHIHAAGDPPGNTGPF